MSVYRINQDQVDYATPAEVIAIVEASGKEATVVRFARERNMPFCLPEFVYHSTGMWVYEDGFWTQRSIFGGVAEVLGVARPD